MILRLLEFALIGLPTLSSFAAVGIRLNNRRKHTPEWQQKRVEHFLTKVELPSTCSELGHMLNDEYGCEFCDALVKIPVYWYSDWDFMVVIDREFDKYNAYGNEYINADRDPRILSVVRTNSDLEKRRIGHVWVDPNPKGFKQEQFNHFQEGLTKVLKQRKLL